MQTLQAGHVSGNMQGGNLPARAAADQLSAIQKTTEHENITRRYVVASADRLVCRKIDDGHRQLGDQPPILTGKRGGALKFVQQSGIGLADFHRRPLYQSAYCSATSCTVTST